MDGKADLTFELADDLDPDGAGLLHSWPLVACIRIAELNEWPPRTGGNHQRPGTVAVLDGRRVDVQLERPAGRVHHGVPFAAFDLLSGIIAPDPAGFGGLDALAVDHRRRRAGLPAFALAVEHHEPMVDRLPGPVVAEPGE